MAVTYRASAIAGNAVSGTNPTVTIVPAVGDLFFVFCAARGNTNATPTCADNNGGSYTRLTNAVYNTSADSFFVFVRTQKLINVNSTIVTVTIGAHTDTEVCVVAVAGSSRAGSNAVLQSANTSNGTGASPSVVTLGGSALTANLTIAAIGFNKTNASAAVTPTSWTERQQAGQGTGAFCEVNTRDSGFTGTVVTWGAGSTANEVNAAYVLEVDGTLASFDYTGEIETMPASTSGTQGAFGDTHEIALAGAGISPKPTFALACYDSLGVRHYWSDTAVVVNTAVAPVPGGGATYTTSTLVQVGRTGGAQP